MTREEILAKSREENGGKDVANIEVSRSGIVSGWIVTVFFSAVLTIVDGIVFGRPAVELMFAVMTGLAVVFFRKYRALRNRHELGIALIYTLASACWFAAWIYQILNR